MGSRKRRRHEAREREQQQREAFVCVWPCTWKARRARSGDRDRMILGLEAKRPDVEERRIQKAILIPSRTIYTWHLGTQNRNNRA